MLGDISYKSLFFMFRFTTNKNLLYKVLPKNYCASVMEKIIFAFLRGKYDV